jgi:hypothetical protein
MHDVGSPAMSTMVEYPQCWLEENEIRQCIGTPETIYELCLRYEEAIAVLHTV